VAAKVLPGAILLDFQNARHAFDRSLDIQRSGDGCAATPISRLEKRSARLAASSALRPVSGARSMGMRMLA
jgi:hypothetical protein